MFSTKKCDKCGTNYDEMSLFCPNCQSQNTNPKLNKVKEMIFLSPIKQVVVFLLGWLGIKVIALLISIIFSIYANQSFTKEEAIIWLDSLGVNMALQVLVYSTIFIGLFFVIYKERKIFFNQFKKIKPLIYGIGIGFLLIASSSAYGMFLKAIGVQTSSNENETLVENLLIGYPIPGLLILGIVGPICEELTYRVGLFSFLRRINRYLAYGVTFLIFGLIHFNFGTTTQADLINELLQLPNYVMAGFLLCFAYEKYGFATSTYAHITNNLFSLIVTLIYSYFGN